MNKMLEELYSCCSNCCAPFRDILNSVFSLIIQQIFFKDTLSMSFLSN